jgi:DNA-binding transcriptional regulator GbsR (MarR family)
LEKDIVDELVLEIGRSSERWGLSSVLGQVWGTLYFKGEMTQEKLKQELGIGLSSISQSIRVLESLGFISPYKKEGRKKVYKAELSKDTIGKIFENLIRFELTPMVSLLQSRKEKVDDKALKEKINSLQKNMEEAGKILSRLMKIRK